jgi:hypothetical protein
MMGAAAITNIGMFEKFVYIVIWIHAKFYVLFTGSGKYLKRVQEMIELHKNTMCLLTIIIKVT